MLRSGQICALLVAASLLGGCQSGPRSQAQGDPRQPSSVDEPPPDVAPLDETAGAVRLRATIYELRVPADAIDQLDAARLAEADFAEPLPGLGDPRALYRVDQTVSLAGDQIVVGAEEPTVTNTRVTDRGQTLSRIEYSSLGAIVAFNAERTGPRGLRVTCTIELSAKSDGPAANSGGMTHPVIRRANMSLKGPVELGETSVLISADASSLDKDGNAVVYVARLVVGG